MSCPICGDVCRCAPTRAAHPGISRFQPDTEVQTVSGWVDPEAYDASEQQFAASLDESAPAPRFVIDPEPGPIVASELPPPQAESAQIAPPVITSNPEPSIFQGYEDPDAWRQELAAKLNEYRSRRQPRAPRYPSLQLKFENSEPDWTSSRESHDPFPAIASRESTALDQITAVPMPAQPALPNAGETTGRLIEFPRPSSGWLEELAEPVMELPRILEVPDTPPPPPALGGILMEPPSQAEEEKRPGIEMPMLSTPMWRRLVATTVDGIFVASAVALFGYIFVRMTGLMPEMRTTIIATAVLTAACWVGYQYLLLVYSGTTLGLKLAGLELTRFDGSAVPRRRRRWRVLTSILSGASLCLGYAWCFLDEDQLCWHDRITRTYMAPRP